MYFLVVRAQLPTLGSITMAIHDKLCEQWLVVVDRLLTRVGQFQMEGDIVSRRAKECEYHRPRRRSER